MSDNREFDAPLEESPQPQLNFANEATRQFWIDYILLRNAFQQEALARVLAAAAAPAPAYAVPRAAQAQHAQQVAGNVARNYGRPNRGGRGRRGNAVRRFDPYEEVRRQLEEQLNLAHHMMEAQQAQRQARMQPEARQQQRISALVQRRNSALLQRHMMEAREAQQAREAAARRQQEQQQIQQVRQARIQDIINNVIQAAMRHVAAESAPDKPSDAEPKPGKDQ